MDRNLHPSGDEPLPRLAVMVSGSGRTLQNLVRRIEEGQLAARIALVIASRECAGAEIARAAGLPTMIVPGEIPSDKLDRILAENRIDWVVLAGYLRRLEIPRNYRERVVNIHPALLPAFGGPGMYGLRVHEAVLRSGAKVSGCTVHLCDEEYDTGRVLLQKQCPVLPSDTPESLAARVFALEREAYPEALARLFSNEKVRRPA